MSMNEKPLALALDDLRNTMSLAADELRRLHARVQELEGASAPVAQPGIVAAVAAERARCVLIVERYQVPVGNSSAGELAGEWTMDALREVRDAIKEGGAALDK